MKLPQPIFQRIHNEAILVEDFFLSFRMGKEIVDISIKAGFHFDGASYPRLLWSLIGSPWDTDVLPAALVHDALYASELVTRAEADSMFLLLLDKNGMGSVRSYNRYLAVRAFGWSLWPHTTKQKCKARSLIRLQFFPPRP